MDEALESMSAAAGMDVRGSLCFFGTDPASVAGDVMMDACDECGSSAVSMVADNRVPGWIRCDDTAVVISGSGDSPDMSAVLDGLDALGCAVVCIAPQGRLSKRCRGAGHRVFEIPEGSTDIDSLMYAAAVSAGIMRASGACDVTGQVADILGGSASDGSTEAFAAEVAGLIRGHQVAVYSTSDIHACSRYWRLVLSSAGIRSFCGELPEFDHNELVGWSDPNPHVPDLRMVVLNGSTPSGLVNSIVGFMAEVLHENGREVTMVGIGSGSALERDMNAIVLGSAVCAALGGSR